ncbi:MAG: SufS family cysteine desulfurase [Vicingaceae bacterium]
METSPATLAIDQVRSEFPILSEMINGQRLVYLDNAATSQKPMAVIDAISNYYKHSNSNVHRGVHSLSQTATSLFEEAREQTKEFISASSTDEIVFTKGTTDSVNLVAHSLGELMIEKGDEIIITLMEHHSNFVPWQHLAKHRGAKLTIVPFDVNGELSPEDIAKTINKKTKVIAITHASNTLGSVLDIKRICEIAHEKDVVVVVDGAQYIPHRKVDVTALDCDFYIFSAHKLFGPTGIGVLYGKKSLLDRLPPYQTGGGMISEVGLDETTFGRTPQLFEAGTPNIAGAIGMSQAMKYLNDLGYANLENQENRVFEYALNKLGSIDKLRIIGNPVDRVPLISFVVDGVHPFDIGSLLDQMGIAVRTGHHCTQPIMQHYDIPGTVRASFAFYNTEEEAHILYEGIIKSLKLLS